MICDNSVRTYPLYGIEMMRPRSFNAGLVPRISAPPMQVSAVTDVLTEEAGLRAARGQEMRIRMVVDEGAQVAEGAPVAHMRDAPDVQIVAPMAGRIGRVAYLPGHKLAEIVLFREPGGDVHSYKVTGATAEAGLRKLMQRAGMWGMWRRRPFGGMPGVSERPAAIFVQALDTRPLAADPMLALQGRSNGFERGLEALTLLTDGSVNVCMAPGDQIVPRGLGQGQVREIECGPRHPQGSMGIQAHRHAPAGFDCPVWAIHAEDVAALGELIETGRVPMTRQVAVSGPAMREARLVRTQIGADLRELTHGFVRRGAHSLLSGSALDGHPAQWLAARDRQITVVPRFEAPGPSHWLQTALARTRGSRPIIPTAALDHSMGGSIPAAAFLRALGAGDEEMFQKLGGLSLLAEDIALADYAVGGDARLTGMLATMLNRISAEHAT